MMIRSEVASMLEMLKNVYSNARNLVREGIQSEGNENWCLNGELDDYLPSIDHIFAKAETAF